MKKRILPLLITISLCLPLSPKKAHADLWGGDVAVLIQILAQAVEQYTKVRAILGTARDNLNLLRDINSGIDEALGALQTIYPQVDLSVYRDWKSLSYALKEAKRIYGEAPKSLNHESQMALDKSFTESMLMYNKLSTHSKTISRVGDRIANQSRSASPKGAQKLTAQAMGVSLQVQNQMLKTQAASLKMQAQDIAYQNKLEKESTKFFLDSARSLKAKMKEHEPGFVLPKY